MSIMTRDLQDLHRLPSLPRQASAAVRLATLSDEDLLWELGMLHATRSTLPADTLPAHSDIEARIVEIEGEYVRRNPVGDALSH